LIYLDCIQTQNTVASDKAVNTEKNPLKLLSTTYSATFSDHESGNLKLEDILANSADSRRQFMTIAGEKDVGRFQDDSAHVTRTERLSE
jgi:hypothetical protein